MTGVAWFLVFLVVVVVVGLILLVAAGAIGVGLGAKDITDRAAAEKNAGTILDAVFDGDRQVVFLVTPRTLSPATVMAGAFRRGYVITTQAHDPATSTTTLVFTKEMP